MTIHLSIIIVNWNTRDLLEVCLDSIVSASLQWSYEIWVVDNASIDHSPEMVRTRFPQVRMIESQENLGFARANNLAIKQSKSTYLLLLNPDTQILPGALDRLISFMEEHPEAGGAGPRLINPDGSLQVSCSPSPTLMREFSRLFHLPFSRSDGYYAMNHWDLHTPHAVDIVLGACMILRREVLEQVGILDEGFFIYSEEVDLCRRIAEAGWKIYWAPQAEVVHFGGQSTKLAAREMFIRLYEGKMVYFRKHYGARTANLYKLVLLSAAIARLMISPLAWLENPVRRQSHIYLANSYLKLIKKLPLM